MIRVEVYKLGNPKKLSDNFYVSLPEFINHEFKDLSLSNRNVIYNDIEDCLMNAPQGMVNFSYTRDSYRYLFSYVGIIAREEN